MQSSGENNLKILMSDLDNLSRYHTYPVSVDIGYLDLCRKLNGRYKNYEMPLFEERKIDIYKPTCDVKDKAYVLFSGGKVSLATALWLREMGKDVELLYLTDDIETRTEVLDLAEKFHLPITTLIRTIPDNEYAGMYMAHYALDYVVSEHNKPSIYMGYFEFALMDHNKKKDWRYCKEFIESYSNVAKKYIKDAEVLGVMPDYAVVNDILLKYKSY